MKVHSLPKCFFFITMKPENTIPQLGFKQFTSLLTKQEACHNRKVCTFKEREKHFLTLAHFMTFFSPCLVATHQHLAILPVQWMPNDPPPPTQIPLQGEWVL
jgi:hypothetical protein